MLPSPYCVTGPQWVKIKSSVDIAVGSGSESHRVLLQSGDKPITNKETCGLPTSVEQYMFNGCNVIMLPYRMNRHAGRPQISRILPQALRPLGMEEHVHRWLNTQRTTYWLLYHWVSYFFLGTISLKNSRTPYFAAPYYTLVIPSRVNVRTAEQDDADTEIYILQVLSSCNT